MLLHAGAVCPGRNGQEGASLLLPLLCWRSALSLQRDRSWLAFVDESLSMCNASAPLWLMLLHAGAVRPEGIDGGGVSLLLRPGHRAPLWECARPPAAAPRLCMRNASATR